MISIFNFYQRPLPKIENKKSGSSLFFITKENNQLLENSIVYDACQNDDYSCLESI